MPKFYDRPGPLVFAGFLILVAIGVVRSRPEPGPAVPIPDSHPTILMELECFTPVELEPGKVGSGAQDLRHEYASKYNASRRAKLKSQPSCEACGLDKEQLARKEAHLETHHVISVQRIYDENLNESLIWDPDNLIVLCRGGTCDEDHFRLGHDPDGPKGPKTPAWAVSNPNVRQDAASKLFRVKSK